MPIKPFFMQVGAPASNTFIGFRGNDLIYTNAINLVLGVTEDALLPLDPTLVKGSAMAQPTVCKLRLFLENKKSVLAMCSTYELAAAFAGLVNQPCKGSTIKRVALTKRRQYT